jgi:hypothetical protein
MTQTMGWRQQAALMALNRTAVECMLMSTTAETAFAYTMRERLNTALTA